MASGIFTNILLTLVLAGIVTVPTLLPAEPANVATSNGTGTNNHSTPANKVVGSGSKVEVVGPQEEAVILTATAKTSKPTDMIFTVSLECTIWTDLTTNNDNPVSNAHSTVLVWIEVDDVIVPINSVSEPPQNPPAGGDDTDKVTFCDREYQREVTDQEDPEDGMDQEADYIRTKSSHSFTWIRQNMGSDTHTIEVLATLITTTAGEASAIAIIGNRVLVAEPTKMANDATI